MKTPYKTINVPVGEASNVKINVDDLPTGVYAVAAYHDVNNNSVLDAGIFGYPLEKYGFSNNVRGFAGRPSYRRSSFYFKNDMTRFIKLK